MKYLPWIIAGVAAVVIVAVLIWSLRAQSTVPAAVAPVAPAPAVTVVKT
jgi:Na+/melibiose symporter-like transporter